MNVPGTLALEGERIRLRRLRDTDAANIHENVKDASVVRWTLRIPHPYPPGEALAFIRSSRYRWREGSCYAFAIVSKGTGRAIGIISLMDLDPEHRTAELGYWLGERYWGQGIATEAVSLVLRVAFDVLGLHRVEANVFTENGASCRVLEKNGFRKEGVRRKARYRFGEWHDEVRYGLLGEEADDDQ